MKAEIQTVKLSQVVFDEVIYPRKDHDPSLVQRYAEVIEEIEAVQKYISLASDMKLLDGKHRWLAYRKKYGDEDREIQAYVYPVTTPHEQLKLACKLNSDHGWQLTDSDKIMSAKSLYAYGASYDDIASALGVGKAKVSEWLSRTVKDNKDKRDAKIVQMWLACHTLEEIGEACGCSTQTAKNVAEEFSNSVLENQNGKLAASASHSADFDLPIYNVWKWQERAEQPTHFGNSDVRIVDRLLYLYTKPFDVVVDPFAGGGSTIDICRKRLRRYLVSDRKPIVEREKEIRTHDLTGGLPGAPGSWKDVRLVYLDPPYWKQAEGKYSTDPTDLANMDADAFHDALAKVVNGFAGKLSGGAHIALIIQPTQWKAPERQFTDHVAEMIRRVKHPIAMRIQAPYESQQCTAQMVEWAKENRQVLVLSREIVVWRIEK